MIEVDGTAYPLEPGKTYLLVVKRGTLSTSTRESLSALLKNRFGISLITVSAEHPDDVQVKGPVNDAD